MRRLGLLLLVLTALAPSLSAMAAKRALVIGISDYQNVEKLPNPPIDVGLVGAKLASAGFEVTRILDPDTTRDKLLTAIGQFFKSIQQGDEVVVYYSGHGIDIDGENLLIPSDAPALADAGSAYALKQRLIALRPMMQEVEDHAPSIQVWILDACRENPYATSGRGFAAQGGLTKVPDQTNSFILFAANYGQTARDSAPSDPPGAHLGSPFSRTFASLFDADKDQDIDLFARQVRQGVVKLVAPDPQFPIFENGVLDEWCFAACGDGPPQAEALGENGTQAPAPPPQAADVPAPQAAHIALARGMGQAEAAKPNARGMHLAVFIGRSSWADCDPATVTPKMPLGCPLLRELVARREAAHRARGPKIPGRTVPVLAPAMVHRAVPLAGAQTCTVATLAPGTQVKLLGVWALRRPADTFYWVTIPGEQPACPAVPPR